MVLHARLDHPCAHGAVVRADPVLRQAHAQEGRRDRHRLRRRRLRARADHRRQLGRLVERLPDESGETPEAEALATRGRGPSEVPSRAPPRRPRPARPRAATAPRRGRRPLRRRGREVRTGRHRHRRDRRRRAPAAPRPRGAGEEETITRPVVRCATWFENDDALHHHRHAGRRPVGDDARGRHAHLAAGARLLHRLRRTATGATPTTSPSCRCSPPRCCSSCCREHAADDRRLGAGRRLLLRADRPLVGGETQLRRRPQGVPHQPRRATSACWSA